ncbi:MAG: alpha/beta hydrolase [Vulcanimicrobiaceae bacterium]
MKPLNFLLTLAFLLASSQAATAKDVLKPDKSFTVGVTHVDKYNGTDDKIPALILIPGLTDSAAVWNGTIAKFAPRHTVYALTLAGFGGTASTPAPMIDKAVADVVALISQEHLVRPVVMGHSMGGFTTIRIAEEHGNLLRGAIAVDGLPVFPGLDTMTAQQRQASAAQMAAPFSHLTADQLYAGAKIYSVPYLTQPQNVDAVVEFGKGADPGATAEYLTEMVGSDLRTGLANVTVPLLELGPFDATLDPKNPQSPTKTSAEKQAYYEKLMGNDRSAQVHMIEKSRHFIMIDQPQAFYEAVEAFLKPLR